MKQSLLLFSALLLLVTGTSSCQPAHTDGTKSIVVTYSVLGAVVKDLVGGTAHVVVPMPNGMDPHEWEPSARDIEAINGADLVVENGLGLEAGMAKTLQEARKKGVKFFTAADHIDVRYVGAGEGISNGDSDQIFGAPDPHLWTDPLAMKSIVGALATELKNDLGLDVAANASDLEARLEALNVEISGMVAGLPEEDRTLVTGHESMGYFARRYRFKLVGAIIPGMSSQAEVSAADLAALKQAIKDSGVRAVFTELGTSPAVASAIASETGVKVVQINTHALPADGSYFTYERELAQTIVNALR